MKSLYSSFFGLLVLVMTIPLSATAIQLLWSSPSQPEQIIPAARLLPSEAYVLEATKTATASATVTRKATRTRVPTQAATSTRTPTRTRLPSRTTTATHTSTRTRLPSRTATWTRTPTKTPTPHCPPSAPLPPPSSLTNENIPHRIGIRVVNGVGEFYDTVTDQAFVPRGSNYVRLTQEPFCAGYVGFYHSTFNPGEYNAARAEQALSQMRQSGYNTVRVFLNFCCTVGIGSASGGLSASYLDNVADFLARAKAHGLYVIVTMDRLPELGGYRVRTTRDAPIVGLNAEYLTTEGVEKSRRFWQDFVRELVARNAAFDAILAYELVNEMYFEGEKPPFSLTGGVVTTANGKTYDMTNAQDKARMLDEGLVYWLDQVRAGIKEVDPTALVGVGFFAPWYPGPTTTIYPRMIRTYYAIADPAQGGSAIDFVDLHLYPMGEPMHQLVENFEINGQTAKPLLMGEFGAFKSLLATTTYAADALAEWQMQSCGYGFKGWLLWTWDSDEQVELWNGMSKGGIINAALSAIERPDPCAPAPGYLPNLALGKPVAVSATQKGHPGTKAVDGLPGTYWSAGRGAPQAIEIDLQGPRTISKLRLVQWQYPAKPASHQVYAKSPNGAYELIAQFDGIAGDATVIEYVLPEPLKEIEFIRVETTRVETANAKTQVGWREIEVR